MKQKQYRRRTARKPKLSFWAQFFICILGRVARGR